MAYYLIDVAMEAIDIIIPMYNSGKFVNDLLEGFNAQTCKEFRLILVDDGSTDNTASLIEQAKGKYDFEFMLVRQLNKGVGAARNQGFSCSTNAIVSFFDSDDIPEKDYVQSILDSFRNQPSIDAVVFSINTIKEGEKRKNYHTSGIPDGLYSNVKLLTYFFESKLRLYVFSIAIKRDLIVKYGISCPEGYKNLEDVNYCYQLLSVSRVVCVSNHPIYNYIVRGSSATTRYNVLNDWDKSLAVMESLNTVFERSCPEFFNYYRVYGVPKLLWTITWQSVKMSKTCESFLSFTKKISSRNAMKLLVHFPRKRVSLSARIFLVSPRLFYILVSFLGRKKNRSI